jgi:hypothetical protein
MEVPGSAVTFSFTPTIEKSIEEELFGPTLADCAARLAAMDRYERRALSRRKFAIREFDAARKALA